MNPMVSSPASIMKPDSESSGFNASWTDRDGSPHHRATSGSVKILVSACSSPGRTGRSLTRLPLNTFGIVPAVSEKVVDRAAARIVLLDPEDRILLQQIRPDEFEERTVWLTPGGGLAPRETYRQAALRELHEEVGQAGASLGPCIWVRKHEFAFRGATYRQRERFFIARTESTAIDSSRHDSIEAEIVLGYRWWKLDEIDGAANTVFAPRLIAKFLAPLIEGRIPDRPINVGV